MSLKEAMPHCYTTYLEWLYDWSVDLVGLAEGFHEECITRTKTRPKEPDKLTCHILCDLWVLSDLLGDKVLCKKMIDSLIELNRGDRVLVIVATVCYVHAHAEKASSLRRWLLDTVAHSLARSISTAKSSSIRPSSSLTC